MNCKSYVAIIIAAAVCMMPALALVEDTTADGLVEGYTTIDGITYKCCLDGDVRTAFITGYDGTLADTDGDGAADGVHIPGSVEHGGNTYSVTDVPKSLFNGTGDTSYRTLGNLVIGEGIVRVPSEVFMFCNIDSISFPSTLEVIGSKTFFRSTGFSEVMLNDGLETLGPSSFSGSSVEKVYVPGSVHINVSETNAEGKVDYGSAYIFTGCDSLREVILGEGLNAIGYKMFGECNSLGTVAIPASVETIDGWAFRYSSATVTFADGCDLAEIGISAFGGKTNDDASAPTVQTTIDTLSSSLTICKDAFTGAYDLGSPGNRVQTLTLMGDWASGDSYITDMQVTVEAGTEYSYHKIPYFTITFDSDGGSAIDPVSAPVSDTVDLSAYASERKGYGFDGWYLEGVRVTEAGSDCTLTARWSLLEDHVVHGGVVYRCYEDGTASIISYEGGLEDTDADGNPDGVFIRGTVECDGRTYSVAEVPGGVFCGKEGDLRSIGNLVIGKGVTVISKGAFQFCDIGALTFETESTLETIGHKAFYMCDIGSASFPDSLRAINSQAFYRATGFSDVTLNEGLEFLGFEAFFRTEVVSVYIPGSVVIVTADKDEEGNATLSGSYSVFAQCSLLEDVILGEGLNAIGYKMFGECNSLGTVAIPASVETIDGWAFRYSSATVTFADGCDLAEIGISAFGGKTNDDSMTPTVQTEISTSADNLSIGPGAFLYAFDADSPGNRVGNITLAGNWSDGAGAVDGLQVSGSAQGTYVKCFSVVFDTGDGTDIEGFLAACGSTVDLGSCATVLLGHSFSWSSDDVPISGGAFVMPAGDVAVTAVWTVNVYTVTWNIEGAETFEQYEYGETPVFTGSTDKAPTAQYTYAFAGWSPEVSQVTGDTTYDAQYSAEVKVYTVTWKVNGHTVGSQWAYGDTPAYNGTPSKAATAQYTYAFAGWSPEVSQVTGDTTYTAVFASSLRSYTITFETDGGSPVSPVTLQYGKAVTAPDDPNKEDYVFAGWNGLPSVMPAENITVTASWTAVQDPSSEEDPVPGGSISSSAGASFSLPIDPVVKMLALLSIIMFAAYVVKREIG